MFRVWEMVCAGTYIVILLLISKFVDLVMVVNNQGPCLCVVFLQTAYCVN